ncbi:MAG TPA: hypothetical protein VHM90_17500 [Phycisphaerae bacterium]|nr:hypothetical protein [Phycisphaerae bacterium]
MPQWIKLCDHSVPILTDWPRVQVLSRERRQFWGLPLERRARPGRRDSNPPED